MIRLPQISVSYEGKDITTDISPHLISLTYTDVLTGRSSDLSLELEDREGNWLKDWYPKKGAVLKASIFYKGQPPLDCGLFQLDRFEFSFPPSTVSLGALATFITISLREKRSEAYEKQSLKAIAETIAARNGLTLTGEIKDIKIDRTTQDNQTDLEFLVRISKEYNYLVKIENGQLIFNTQEAVEKFPSAFTLSSKEIKTLRLTDKREGIYKSCEISYQLGTEKTEIKFTVSDPFITDGDVLKIKEKVENKEQAEEKATAALKKANSSQIEGSLTTEGISNFLAGTTFNLEGFGVFAGKYVAIEVAQTLTKNGGWESKATIRKINPETATIAGRESTPPVTENATTTA